MASLNSYGHESHDDRWILNSKTRQQATALSSYKGGEGVNVDQLAGDSDAEKSDDNDPSHRSAAQRLKDRSRAQRPAHLQPNGSKFTAAKDKRKIREKRRSTGVIHLPIADQNAKDSVEDDDEDGENTKQNTTSNEVAATPQLATQSSPLVMQSSETSLVTRASIAYPAAPVATMPEYPRLSQKPVIPSTGIKRQSNDIPSSGGGLLSAGSHTSLESANLSFNGRDEASLLRSCLKGTAPNDAMPRRPVTSLVSRFEQNRPISSNGAVNTSTVSTVPTLPIGFRAVKEEDEPARNTGYAASRATDGSSASIRTGPVSTTQAHYGAASALVRHGDDSLTAATQQTPRSSSSSSSVLPPWKQAEATARPLAAPASSTFSVSSPQRVVLVSEDAAPRVSALLGGRLQTCPDSRVNDASKPDELQRKNADLIKQLDKLQGDNAQLQKLLLEKDRDNERLKAELRQKDAHIAELTKEIGILDHDLDELDLDNVKLAEENEVLRRAVTTLSIS